MTDLHPDLARLVERANRHHDTTEADLRRARSTFSRRIAQGEPSARSTRPRPARRALPFRWTRATALAATALIAISVTLLRVVPRGDERASDETPAGDEAKRHASSDRPASESSPAAPAESETLPTLSIAPVHDPFGMRTRAQAPPPPLPAAKQAQETTRAPRTRRARRRGTFDPLSGDLEGSTERKRPSGAPFVEPRSPDRSSPRLELVFKARAVLPEPARKRGVDGWVDLRVTVDADGRVIDEEVLRAEPPSIFNESARRAVRGYRYNAIEPGGSDRRPLRHHVERVRFGKPGPQFDFGI